MGEQEGVFDEPGKAQGEKVTAELEAIHAAAEAQRQTDREAEDARIRALPPLDQARARIERQRARIAREREAVNAQPSEARRNETSNALVTDVSGAEAAREAVLAQQAQEAADTRLAERSAEAAANREQYDRLRREGIIPPRAAHSPRAQEAIDEATAALAEEQRWADAQAAAREAAVKPKHTWKQHVDTTDEAAEWIRRHNEGDTEPGSETGSENQEGELE